MILDIVIGLSSRVKARRDDEDLIKDGWKKTYLSEKPKYNGESLIKRFFRPKAHEIRYKKGDIEIILQCDNKFHSMAKRFRVQFKNRCSDWQNVCEYPFFSCNMDRIKKLIREENIKFINGG